MPNCYLCTNCIAMLRKFMIVVAFALGSFVSVKAITPPIEELDLARAKSLLEHGRWSDANTAYKRLMESVSTEDVATVEQIEYALTVCAAKLHDNIAEQRMKLFLMRYPGSVHATDIRFLLALHYCEQEEFEKAKAQFAGVHYNALTREDREKYDVRMGYIEFLDGNLDSAYEYFERVPSYSQYVDHATYYKAYIHYTDGEYDKAYKGFISLSDSEAYSKVVPFYLLQLEFDRGNYKYVRDNCDELLGKAAEAEKGAILRMAAESWYRCEDYQKTLQYITAYKNGGGKMGREENYMLGYATYRMTDYAGAIQILKSVCNGTDDIAQNASYHLADCYIRLGDKRNSINAFAMAADERYNNDIAEDALFNYGKLLFETGGGTFNGSINVLTRYVTRYPDSPRASEAKELLIAAYYNSKDYDMAYDAIRSFPNPDGSMRTALQKIAYFKGIKAFKAGDDATAKRSIAEALEVGVSPKYNALCAFWLGEIAYRGGDYPEALKQYNYYLKRAPRTANEYKMALYNLGYTHIALGDAPAAQRSLEGFIWLYKSRDSYRADGFNRLADVQYLQRNYNDAVKNYENAVALNTEQSHYARYRRAMSLGLLGKESTKIDALKRIITAADGDYVDDASYELGRTHLAAERYSAGAEVLETLLKNYPTTPYNTAAMLDLGLAYFNMGNTERSLECYDKIIATSPQSQAAKDAMQSVREIYVSRGDVNSYFAYAEKTGVECDLSVVTRDSLSYRSAEQIYLAGKNRESIPHFEEYIASYPKGYYIDDALFCLSDSYLKCDSLDRALESMKLLADRPNNRYTVPVLEKLGSATFDKGMYSEAASAYRRLYDLSPQTEQRLSSSKRYVDAVMAENIDEQIFAMAEDVDSLIDVEQSARRKALFGKGRVLSNRNKQSQALAIFETLSSDKSDVAGAESAYRIICHHFQKGDHAKAEQLVYDLAESKTPHTYYLGRSFIILGDIYAAKGDTFQARATYQSIIDGYSPADDGVVAEAKGRIAKLL